MQQSSKLSLLDNRESGEKKTATQSVERFPALAEAGLLLGLTGPALRKKFDRGDLPRKFLLRLGPRTLRVDIAGLVRFLKGQASEVSA